jgi:hypothetical protein
MSVVVSALELESVKAGASAKLSASAKRQEQALDLLTEMDVEFPLEEVA